MQSQFSNKNQEIISNYFFCQTGCYYSYRIFAKNDYFESPIHFLGNLEFLVSLQSCKLQNLNFDL